MTHSVSLDYRIIERAQGPYRLTEKRVENREYHRRPPADRRHRVVRTVSGFGDDLKSSRVRGNGKELAASQIQRRSGGDVFVSDTSVHTYVFADRIEPGDKVRIDHRKEYDGLAFMPTIRVPNLGYLESFRVKIKHPQSMRIEFEPFFSRDSFEYTVIRNKRTVTELRIEGREYLEPLPYFAHNQTHATFLLKILDEERVLNIATPDAFVEWYLGLIDRDPVVPEEFMQEVQERMRDDQTDLEKLAFIYDYVRDALRYVADMRGDHAIVPHDPGYSLEQGYGDCKDRAYAVYALARSLGIEVDMAVVAMESRPAFEGTHLGTFNHMICSYEDSDRLYYFDPTCRQCEFGNLPGRAVGAQVLRLTSDAPWPARIPSPTQGPTVELVLRGVLGSLTATAEVRLRNDFAFAARAAEANLHGVEKQNFYQDLLNETLYAITLTNFSLSEALAGEVILTAEADVSRFFLETGRSFYAPKTPFRVIDPDVLDRAEDAFEVELGPPVALQLTAVMDLAGQSVKPSEYSIGAGDSGFLRARSSADAAGGSWRLDYSFARPRARYADESKRQLLNFAALYIKAKPSMFSIGKEAR